MFALGDLLPEHRPCCDASQMTLVSLIYRGFNPPLLFTLGVAESLTQLFGELVREPELGMSPSANTRLNVCANTWQPPVIARTI